MAISIYLSITILNVNGLNVLNQKTYSAWMETEKQDQYTCCLQQSHFRSEDTQRDSK